MQPPLAAPLRLELSLGCCVQVPVCTLDTGTCYLTLVSQLVFMAMSHVSSVGVLGRYQLTRQAL